MTFQSSSPRSLWRFYWPMFRSEWRTLLMRSANRVGREIVWIGAALTLGVALNNQIGDRLQQRWLHFSALFALIPLAADVAYALLDLGYQEHLRTEAENEVLRGDVSALMGIPANLYPRIRSEVARSFTNIPLESMDRATLVEWLHESVDKGLIIQLKPSTNSAPPYLSSKGVNRQLRSDQRVLDAVKDRYEELEARLLRAPHES